MTDIHLKVTEILNLPSSETIYILSSQYKNHSYKIERPKNLSRFSVKYVFCISPWIERRKKQIEKRRKISWIQKVFRVHGGEEKTQMW